MSKRSKSSEKAYIEYNVPGISSYSSQNLHPFRQKAPPCTPATPSDDREMEAKEKLDQEIKKEIRKSKNTTKDDLQSLWAFKSSDAEEPPPGVENGWADIEIELPETPKAPVNLTESYVEDYQIMSPDIKNMNVTKDSRVDIMETENKSYPVEEHLEEITKQIEEITIYSPPEPPVVCAEESKNKEKFGDFSLDDLRANFQVVTALAPGTKLEIQDGIRLKEDSSYFFSGLERKFRPDSRERLIDFFCHLFEETRRNLWKLLNDIRQAPLGADRDTNLSTLVKCMESLHSFMANYSAMSDSYRKDSSAYASFCNIYDKFETFIGVFYREMLNRSA